MKPDSTLAVEFVSLVRRQLPAAWTETLLVEGGPARVDVWLGQCHCQVVFRLGNVATMNVAQAWDKEYCIAAPVDLDLPSVDAAADFVARALSSSVTASLRHRL
jgi:hypothetical protein